MLYAGWSLFCFLNDTATTESYTLSLHDALPIFQPNAGSFTIRKRTADGHAWLASGPGSRASGFGYFGGPGGGVARSEEHTSELQSRHYLVCRLLLATTPIPLHTTPLHSKYTTDT